MLPGRTTNNSRAAAAAVSLVRVVTRVGRGIPRVVAGGVVGVLATGSAPSAQTSTLRGEPSATGAANRSPQTTASPHGTAVADMAPEVAVETRSVDLVAGMGVVLAGRIPAMAIGFASSAETSTSSSAQNATAAWRRRSNELLSHAKIQLPGQLAAKQNY